MLCLVILKQRTIQMSEHIRYSDEFKIEAVAKVSARGYSVKEVSERLGISTKVRTATEYFQSIQQIYSHLNLLIQI